MASNPDAKLTAYGTMQSIAIYLCASFACVCVYTVAYVCAVCMCVCADLKRRWSVIFANEGLVSFTQFDNVICIHFTYQNLNQGRQDNQLFHLGHDLPVTLSTYTCLLAFVIAYLIICAFACMFTYVPPCLLSYIVACTLFVLACLLTELVNW